ncbi:MAG: inositol monophosphatase family protein [Solirubrobacterales bacterium]
METAGANSKEPFREKELQSAAESIARAAGAHIMAEQLVGRKVLAELSSDVKLEADLILERFILAELSSRTGLPILSEECGWEAGRECGSGPHWIVDPLDGTVNFSRAIPLSCISIALWDGTRPVLGVIYDFYRDECFSGLTGHGAWLNGEPMRVSEVADKHRAMICTGFPPVTDFNSPALTKFVDRLRAYRKVRSLGSAALSIAYVACGRMDLYIENDLRIWDIAAGIPMVLAAGGQVRYEPTSIPFGYRIAAANQALGLLEDLEPWNG